MAEQTQKNAQTSNVVVGDVQKCGRQCGPDYSIAWIDGQPVVVCSSYNHCISERSVAPHICKVLEGVKKQLKSISEA